MTTTPPGRTILITGSDSNYFPLLRDAISSFLRFPQSKDIVLGVLDFGLEEDERRWIKEQGGELVIPELLMDVPEQLKAKKWLGYLARLFLPEYFPGYDRYFWFDADAWLQTWDAIDAFIAGADEKGFAAAHESDPGYLFDRTLARWNTQHYLHGYGLLTGSRLVLRRKRVNAGLFCIRADAPHWQEWRTSVMAAVRKTGRAIPHDQFAMNRMLFVDGLPVHLLEPPNNWICSRGIPRWDQERAVFCTPNREQTPISVMHLAGHRAKDGSTFEVRTTDGGVIHTGLRFSQRPQAGGAAS